MRKALVLLLALLFTATMAGVAIGTEDPDNPANDDYTTTPNNSRHDANDWNGNSLFAIDFTDSEFEDKRCSAGLGWDLDGNANEWVVTAGHCLPYRLDDGDADIDGVSWFDTGVVCQPGCGDYPSNRNNWGFYPDTGLRTTMWCCNGSDEMDQIAYAPWGDTYGDIALIRVDKEHAATKVYTALGTKHDLGAKFTPSEDTYYSDICVYSSMNMEENCGWTIQDLDDTEFQPTNIPATEWNQLSQMAKNADGTCTLEEGDSGSLVYRKVVSGETTTIRPVGIVTGNNTACSDFLFQDEEIVFTSIDMLDTGFPGAVMN